MWNSSGTGDWLPDDLGALGDRSVIELGVLIFNPAFVRLGCDVYVGHRAMLRGDTRGLLEVGDGSWLGHDVYLQSAGGISIGKRVGVGPRVMAITAVHAEVPFPAPIMDGPLEMQDIVIEDGADIGMGAMLLPGAHVGRGAQVGAGAVVRGTIPPGAVAAGIPARRLGWRAGAGP